MRCGAHRFAGGETLAEIVQREPAPSGGRRELREAVVERGEPPGDLVLEIVDMPIEQVRRRKRRAHVDCDAPVPASGENTDLEMRPLEVALGLPLERMALEDTVAFDRHRLRRTSEGISCPGCEAGVRASQREAGSGAGEKAVSGH